MAVSRGTQGRIRVGISGWNYAPWRGVFYPERLPHARELSYFAYRRLHGSREPYAIGYRPKAIVTWADRMAAWAGGNPPSGPRVSLFSPIEARPHDVYVYFDNGMKVHAPSDALSLERRLAKLGFAHPWNPSLP
jgi:uncharacterized protein YecE (DUF72 family)